jgi:hypothetical protein
MKNWIALSRKLGLLDHGRFNSTMEGKEESKEVEMRATQEPIREPLLIDYKENQETPALGEA